MNIPTATPALVCAGIFALPSHAYDDKRIVALCDEDWGTDTEMVAYCRDQQRAAGETWDAIVDGLAEGSDEATIVAYCLDRWGDDYKMLVYCDAYQNAARAALAVNPIGVPQDVMDGMMRDCREKWGTDFQMLHFCRDKKTKAWMGAQ